MESAQNYLHGKAYRPLTAEIVKGSVFCVEWLVIWLQRLWSNGSPVSRFSLPYRSISQNFIRETRFAEGFPFVFSYSWGLVAVLALPVFLLAQLYFLALALRRGSAASERRLLFFNALAFCFGLIAECIFILARR